MRWTYLWAISVFLNFHFAPAQSTIAFYGDSITAGFLVDDQKSFPYLLQDKWQQSEDLDSSIQVYGKPGASSYDALSMLDEDGFEIDADIIFLEFGMNDLIAYGDTAFSENKTYDFLKKIILKFRNENKKVVLLEVRLPDPKDEQKKVFYDVMKFYKNTFKLYQPDLKNTYERLCQTFSNDEGMHCIDNILSYIYEDHQKCVDEREDNNRRGNASRICARRYTVIDGIHPNWRGHFWIAEKIYVESYAFLN